MSQPRTTRSFAMALAGLALSACAALPPPEGIRLHDTADLAEVTARGLALADELGPGRVLVAFDLDNTLLAMRSEIGSDQWYDWQKALQRADPCDERLVPDRLAVQGALYHVGAMRPTQDDAAELVATLQAAGVPTLVATSRGPEFRLATFRELRRSGLDFEHSAPGPTGGLGRFQPPGAVREVRYEDGVYLLSGQHKGDLLLALLERIDARTPAVVVFVDDKSENIEAMREGLERAGIAGELFHYRREDERVEGFDGDRAYRDWQTLAPALATIESVMGPVNFDLPDAPAAAECP